VDQLPGLELLLEALHLPLERLDLGEATQGDLDGRDQLALLKGLDQVGEGTRVAGLLDQVALAEGGEDEHGRPPLARDLPGSGEAVHAGHLDVEDGQVGLEVLHQLHGFVAAPGLAHDLVALLLQDLLQVEADDGLVLSDHHAHGQRLALLRSWGYRERDSMTSLSSSSSWARSSSPIDA